MSDVIFTQFVRPDIKSKIVQEFPSSESEVDEAGYRTLEEQVNSLIDAGMRLEMARAQGYGEYDFEDDADLEANEDFYDPTRSSGFDLADASRIKNQLEDKIRGRNAKVVVPDPGQQPKSDVKKSNTKDEVEEVSDEEKKG